MIELKHVSKTFGEYKGIEDLNFQIQPGEIFGFIGPSGSGKTTTVRLMTGIYQPTSGEVNVFGRPAHRIDTAMRSRIGYLPQLFILYPQLSVQENMDFVASLYGQGLISRRKRRRELLEFVELWPHRRKLAKNISGGMQRRLELASALIHDPTLLFLDEPTAGIDPILRTKFWDAFRELKAQGRTLFVTTQYVTEAEFCDHVAVLDHGRVVALDTPENLRRMAFEGELLEVRAPRISQAERRLLMALDGVQTAELKAAGRMRLTVDNAETATPDVLEALNARGIEVEGIQVYKPTIDEVFVRLLQKEASNG